MISADRPAAIIIRRPDDMHLHLRDGAMLLAVAGQSAWAGRAVVMPNLSPPVTTVAQALAYRQRILTALPPGAEFDPRMAVYLTERTPVDEIDRIADAPQIACVKYYPAGATTNAELGVGDWRRVIPLLERMAQRGVILSVHGEVSDADVDPFDRETLFVERILSPMMAQLPTLKIVLEHISSAAAATFVRQAPSTLAASVTPHHLSFNRSLWAGGRLNPHGYCHPVIKRESDRLALVAAVTGEDAPRFFLGTDSAPHPRSAKACDRAAAGVFSAPAALPLTAQVFAEAGALDKLSAFVGENGARFYGWSALSSRVTLAREAHRIADSVPVGDDPAQAVTPLCAGQTLNWRVL
ncbi:dihydroorotase [Magnetofaba australis]|uniref:Dihydroorotase n=1 Tax=Magnetofaba australis IT-1 TaxID=1434232 RepID=A0A1Y2K9R6_9PROT|nr:dihydroorotase [Magnetofaba australis]OSM07633.1 putative dihydroorotase, homodimeric type [Magnetofaba australis IT-1]